MSGRVLAPAVVCPLAPASAQASSPLPPTYKTVSVNTVRFAGSYLLVPTQSGGRRR